MPFLNEEQRRLYVASEAKSLGRGGKRFIERELCISRMTINRGISDLETSNPANVSNSQEKQRKKGGGRKKSIADSVWKNIETFIMPHTCTVFVP